MAGRVWVPELNKYVDIFDSPEAVPDQYLDQHVAVPEQTVREQERYEGGAAIIREPQSTGSRITGTDWMHPTGHETLDNPGYWQMAQPVGVLPIVLILGIIALIMIALALIVFFLVATSSNVQCIHNDPTTGECDAYLVQAGLASPHVYDPQSGDWMDLGGGMGDVLKTLSYAIIAVAAGYIAFKFVLPAIQSKRTEA